LFWLLGRVLRVVSHFSLEGTLVRVIAHELVTSIRNNVSVDWMHREAARARMRVVVKLRKYGYPPDLQDAAVQKVLQQAEALSEDWAA
jgi:type I restriction enzyme R subunit